MYSLKQYPSRIQHFFISAITAALFIGFCTRYIYVVLLNNTEHVINVDLSKQSI